MIRSTAVSCLIFLLCINVHSQNALPRSIPEKEGVSSQSIINFIDSAPTGKNEFHSFMYVRHGKVIAEGWWNPYRAQLKHTMYSCSKSFTATAIGLAVKEKKLKVTDKVASFFPGEIPDSAGTFLRDMTIRDLLIMSTGQEPDPTFPVVKQPDWIKAFLAWPIMNKPGTVFHYNSVATYMLSAIIQKVTGEKLLDYLTPRLFKPLGIEGMDWEVDPQGINVGGWGLRLKTEDMAKFGLLFLREGKWKRKRILPKSWIKEATTVKIIQHPEYPQSKRDSSEWEQGYCYQMWRNRHNSYRADGAFGQFILIMPDQDAVIAITSETQNMQSILDNVWKHLLPGIQKKRMKESDSLSNELNQRLNSLVLPIPGNSNTSDLIDSISGKIFSMNKNDKNFETVSFSFDEEVCTAHFKTDKSEHTIRFGLRKWIEGETDMKPPSLLGVAQASLTGLPPFKLAAEYNWRDDNKLELVLRYIESPHTETISCYFNENKLEMEIRESFRPETTKLTGEIKQ